MSSARFILATASAVTSLVLSAAWFGAAFAQDDPATWPGMNALDNSGFASADQVAAAFGNYSIEVICPSVRRDGPLRERGAHITVNNGAGFQNNAVLSTLFLEALHRTWADCYMAHSIGVSHEMADRDVGFAEVYGPSPNTGQQALLVRANSYSGMFYRWDSVTNMVAQAQRQAAAAEQQRVANEQTAAQVQQQAAQQAEAQVAGERRAAEWNAWWTNLWDTIKTLFWIGLGLWVVGWLFKRRNAIARWYFFTFHPHPAVTAVHSAINTGSFLDGRQLATVLGEVPSGNSVFRQVRIEQSAALLNEMQTATQAHLRQMQSRAKEQYEHAAVQQAQAALAEAAISLEQAKAMLSASKRSAPT